jgi:hypothetical protein
MVGCDAHCAFLSLCGGSLKTQARPAAI